MKKTPINISAKACDFPTHLKTADEIASSLKCVSSEKLINLANADYVPHYTIDGGEPLFKVSEVKAWLARNSLQQHYGRDLPKTARFVINPPPISDNPPKGIECIPELFQIPTNEYRPGVYFLCLGDSVIYVGQSVHPAVRVSQHKRQGALTFDRAYMIPAPEHDLDNIEGAFIEMLKPSQQGGIRLGLDLPVKPYMTKPMSQVMKELKIEMEVQHD